MGPWGTSQLYSAWGMIKPNESLSQLAPATRLAYPPAPITLSGPPANLWLGHLGTCSRGEPIAVGGDLGVIRAAAGPGAQARGLLWQLPLASLWRKPVSMGRGGTRWKEFGGSLVDTGEEVEKR